MAKNSVSEWSTSASSNTDVAGVDIGEGCNPGNVNNAMRAIMAQLAAFLGSAEVSAFADLETGLVYTSSSGGEQAVAAGKIVRVNATGRIYKVLASDATNADLDYTGSGGVKLADLQKWSEASFTHWAAQPDGTTFMVNGVPFIVDSSKTGTQSVANFYSVDGIDANGDGYFEHFGADPDATDNYAAIQRAIEWSSATGSLTTQGRKVIGRAGETYRISESLRMRDYAFLELWGCTIENEWDTATDGVTIREGVIMIGYGRGGTGSLHFDNITKISLGAAISYGDTTVTVATGQGVNFTVGDIVGVHGTETPLYAGHDPNNIYRQLQFEEVTAINGDVLTLKYPILEDIPLAGKIVNHMNTGVGVGIEGGDELNFIRRPRIDGGIFKNQKGVHTFGGFVAGACYEGVFNSPYFDATTAISLNFQVRCTFSNISGVVDRKILDCANGCQDSTYHFRNMRQVGEPPVGGAVTPLALGEASRRCHFSGDVWSDMTTSYTVSFVESYGHTADLKVHSFNKTTPIVIAIGNGQNAFNLRGRFEVHHDSTAEVIRIGGLDYGLNEGPDVELIDRATTAPTYSVRTEADLADGRIRKVISDAPILQLSPNVVCDDEGQAIPVLQNVMDGTDIVGTGADALIWSWDKTGNTAGAETVPDGFGMYVRIFGEADTDSGTNQLKLYSNDQDVLSTISTFSLQQGQTGWAFDIEIELWNNGDDFFMYSRFVRDNNLTVLTNRADITASFLNDAKLELHHNMPATSTLRIDRIHARRISKRGGIWQ